jgi:hypothetical protein
LLEQEEDAMQMLIDGEWVDASDGAADPICDEASGALIETAPRGTAEWKTRR